MWYANMTNPSSARFRSPYHDVTRVEVIDADGRSYTNHKVQNVELSLQDDGRTLKVFIKEVKNDKA